MRVIHLTVTIDRGGSENHLVSLIELQKKNNYDVLVIYLKGNPYWMDHLHVLGVNIKQISVFTGLFELIKIISKFKPDVLHAHLQTSEVIARIALLFHPTLKFIISKHNDEDSRFLPAFIQKYFYKFIAKRASKVVAISENVKLFCINKLNIKSKKIEVVYYGIDPSIYDIKNLEKNKINALLQELKIGNSDFVVGSIARLHPQKSLDTLIEAVNFIVNEKKIKNLKCVIVGEGYLEESLKKLVTEFRLTEHVKFTGKRSDIPNVLQVFDVFVLCSIYEGLGLVLLESMSAKIPIIGTRAGAIPEIIEDAGIIIEKRDYIALSDSILDLKRDNIKRHEIIEKAYSKINHQFSLEHMFKKIDKIYNLN